MCAPGRNRVVEILTSSPKVMQFEWEAGFNIRLRENARCNPQRYCGFITMTNFYLIGSSISSQRLLLFKQPNVQRLGVCVRNKRFRRRIFTE